MLTNEEIHRYKRHILLSEIGEKGQLTLKNARVLVVGAGGLASAVLPYLAAAGVGNITVIDNDVVDETNLQRQVLFTESDIGKSKAQIAVTRMRQINSRGNYEAIHALFTEENALKLAQNKEVIVDCVDQIHTRYLINDVAVYMGIPMVFGAIHKFEGQVAVFNYAQASTYRCAFPEQMQKEPPQTCEEAGVIGVLPGIIGTYQANETIKTITGAGEVLAGKLLMIDVLRNSHHVIEVAKSDRSVAISNKRMQQLEEQLVRQVHDIQCGELEQIISSIPDIQLVDIRQETDRKVIAGKEVVHVPVTELERKLHLIHKQKPVLVFCGHGVNSRWAVEVLKQNNFKTIYHLMGGISAAKI